MSVARYYRVARTAHLERLHDMVPGDFFYRKAMYDFDLTRAPTHARVKKVSLSQVLRDAWRGTYDTMEIVEPLAPSAIVETVAISLVTRLRGRRNGTRLVTYAIENADLPEKLAAKLPIPVTLARLAYRSLSGFGYRSMTRVCFGTTDAERNYRRLLGTRALSRAETRVIPALPSPHEIDPAPTRLDSVIFVGTFEHRKGIIQLLEAWPEVKRLQPTARLTVLGRGSLEAEVRTQCRDLRDVDLQVAPPRELIWRSLASHHVLCLFSQPSLQWKEQVGLPIVEALSLGLEVVASDETGLAEWLESHGHIVVPWSSTAMELARAISDAIGSPRTRASIQAALPETDGRLEADRWLHSDPARDVGGQSA